MKSDKLGIWDDIARTISKEYDRPLNEAVLSRVFAKISEAYARGCKDVEAGYRG